MGEPSHTQRSYTPGGVLRREEERDAAGRLVRVVAYHDDGTPLVERRYDARGHEVFEAYWFQNGTLRAETVDSYDGDELLTRRQRGPGGALRFEAKREGPTVSCVVYHDTGKPHAIGQVQGEQLHGRWRICDRDGAPTLELDVGEYRKKTGLAFDRLPAALGEVLLRHLYAGQPAPLELAGVDELDWTAVEGCHGGPVMAQLPLHLRGLLSSQPLVRAAALAGLTAETEHQGAVYEATARVTPFLLRALAHPNADRPALLGLLQRYGECARPYAADVAGLAATDPARIAIVGTLAALGAGWPAVWALMDGAGPELRRQILLFAKFSQEQPLIKADLAGFARRSSDAALRACAVATLGDVAGVELADLAPGLADADPLVRTATAVVTATRFGAAAPEPVVAALEAALAGWRDLAPAWSALPYTELHLLADLAQAVGAIRSPRAQRLATAIAADLDEVDGHSATVVGKGLLTLVFGAGERPFGPAFLEVLEALGRSRKFHVFNVDAGGIMQRWRLPNTPEQLVALAAAVRSTADPEASLHARMADGG